MRQKSFFHRVVVDFKEDLRVWHILATALLIGIVAGVVVTHGKSQRLQLCQQKAEEFAKQRIVQQIEMGADLLPSDTGTVSGNDAKYQEIYTRCLTDAGMN